MHDERRLVDDAPRAVDHLGELAGRLQAVAAARLGEGLLGELEPLVDGALGGRLGGLAVTRHVEQLVGHDVRVPDVELVHLGEGRHVLAVGTRGGERGLSGHVLTEAVVAAGQHEARRQALEVPFERSRQGLVEIVDVEQQLALG